MKLLKTLVFSTAALTAFGTSLGTLFRVQPSYVMAAQQLSPKTALMQLRDASDEVARLRTLPLSKGPVQVRYMERQSQLDLLIDRLRAGEKVSPDQIDRALEGYQTPRRS